MSTTLTNVDGTNSPWSLAGVALYGLIISTILSLIFYYWQRNKRYFRLGNAIPGPPGIPLLGNALEVLLTPEELLIKALEYGKVYGKIARGWLGPYLVVFLIDPRDVEIILNSQVHIDKSDEYKFFKPWLGEGLLISSGEKWRSHRKMIAPTFHMNILKSFMDVFNRNSLAVVRNMRKEIDREFDVHDYMSGITVDILLETAMGVKRTHSDNAGYDYAVAVMKMCDILHQRHYKIWMRFEPLFNLSKFAKKQLEYLGIIHGLTNKVIKTKKEEFMTNRVLGNELNYFKQLDIDAEISEQREANMLSNNTKTLQDTSKGTPLRDDLDEIDEQDVGEKKRLAFLDLMIETAHSTQNLTDEEIKEEVDTIMFEGHDTTAAGSSFVLCLLGIHKDVQDKVYQELYDIFGNSDRPVTYLDTLEMKYLERVIMETLRLYPPVPIIARKINQEVKLASGDYTLPVGCTVVIGTYKIHHDPDYFKNPDTFDPDNFLPERTQNRHYYSYIPFSAGPRSCVGRKYAMLKLKVLLATILRNYIVMSDVTEQDFRLTGDIILKRADGFRLRIQPRPKLSV